MRWHSRRRRRRCDGRVMAGLLDGALITMGTLAAIAVFVLTVTYLTHEPLTVPSAGSGGDGGGRAGGVLRRRTTCFSLRSRMRRRGCGTRGSRCAR